MASKYAPGTLPDHDRCVIHRGHLLGCKQYEQMLTRSGQRCEICGRPSAECVRGKLVIDHYGPDWGVRGLLCDTCNKNLTTRARAARWAADYLANAWWVKECERLGVPLEITPEPGYGSAIRDQFDVLWMREGDGKWRPSGAGRPGISWASWEWLYDHRGPQNMALLDLDADPWRWRDVEKAALEGLVSDLDGQMIRHRRIPERSRHLVTLGLMDEFALGGRRVLCLLGRSTSSSR